MFISLLILNMLIIFFGVYTYFFNVKDYTLIAGIIAFIGAIIGGYITLMGVRQTIEASVKIEYKSKIPDKVQSIYMVKNHLEKKC